MRKRFSSLNSAKVRLSVLLSAIALVPAGVFVLSQKANAQQAASAEVLTFPPVDLWTGSSQYGVLAISGTMYLPYVPSGVCRLEVFTNYGSISLDFNADDSNQGFYVYYETPPFRKTYKLHVQRLGSNEDHTIDLPSETFDVLTTIKIHPALGPNGRHIRAESAGLELEGHSNSSGGGNAWYVTNLSPLQGR
jgi:hypothetical protein